MVIISLSLSTASYDYTPGPYTVSFTAGQMYATFMVSSLDDQLAELSEYFTLMITSVDRLDVVEIGSPNTSVITIEDNDGACVCACVCTLECHGWVESFIYVCTQYERLSLNASTICMQWHICTYNMTCMYMYMHKVLYNFFTCSCSADVCSTKLHCH